MSLREVTPLDRLYAQVSGLEKQAQMIRRELAAILAEGAPKTKPHPTTSTLIDPRNGKRFQVKNPAVKKPRRKP